jgi:uncharacterized protein (DUF2147 family)
MLKVSAFLAVIAGLAMAGVKFALAEALWWPFAIIEYVAAALLLTGAALALWRGRAVLLGVSWGLTAGVTWSTLFHHLQERASAGALEFALGALLVTALAGAALAAWPASSACPIPTRSGLAALILAVLAAALHPGSAAAQSNVTGRWATQGFGSIVELEPCENDAGALCGRIRWLWQGNDADGRPRTDARNPDRALRGRALVGAEIIRGFRQSAPGQWTGGALYNPDDGRTYSGTIRLRQNTLLLQGCALSVFCQTQVWRRPEDLLAAARGGE